MSPLAGDASARAPAQRRIAVLLVEDHQLVAEAVSRILALESDIMVTGVVGTVAATMAPGLARPDVVLMDYRLPDGTGAQATRVVKARWPTARVIMLTGLADERTVYESIRAGADGFLTKDNAIAEVVDAVRAARAGKIQLPSWVVRQLARRVADAAGQEFEQVAFDPLTTRELEVLRALSNGLSTPQICERLMVTSNTVRTYVQHICAKLGAHSKLEAVVVAVRYGLVEPPVSEVRPARSR